jgi:SAM-dependent methyltransferase
VEFEAVFNSLEFSDQICAHGRSSTCTRFAPPKTRMKAVAVTSAPTVIIIAIIAVWQFPYATDDPVRREDALRAYSNMAYAPSSPRRTMESEWTRAAASAKYEFDIEGQVRDFVEHYALQNAKVLEIGSGSGYLQDVVDDYTGLDIASSVARHYHKPFVAGTATALPFADSRFDAAWSIWVLEHIPNPEAALTEMRRVLKPGALLFLMPAWEVKPWVAQGYEIRSYNDLGVRGKLVKASIPTQNTLPFWLAATVPARAIRSAAAASGPVRLHYRRLTPNYEQYWQADSDAVNSLDVVETALWFQTRGDECLNCPTGVRRLLQPNYQAPLIIRIRKPANRLS